MKMESDTPVADVKDPLLREFIEDVKARRIRDNRRLRWAIVKWAVWVLPVLFAVSVMVLQNGSAIIDEFTKPYVAVVSLTGTISESGRASSRAMVESLNAAFRDKRAKGIVIRVNSRGGSATQSSLIRDHLDRMKRQHPDKRVIAVAEDTMASGAYLIASGADMIYVHASTITGSIGVIIESWGLKDVLDKVGVEHRSFTAGEHKGRLSQFEALRQSDRDKADSMVKKTHEQFIDYVKRGRGERLTGEPTIIFSGDVFLGSEAVEYGLVDKLGDLEDAIAVEFGVNSMKDYSSPDSFLTRIEGLGASLGLASLPNFTEPGTAILYQMQ